MREVEPFYIAPGPLAPSRGRLLLVSYHFPPSQAPGALRWERLARHAADHGWGLDVVTLDPREIPNADTERLRGLPGGTRVFGVPQAAPAVERLEHFVWRCYRALRPKPRFQPSATSTRAPTVGPGALSVRARSRGARVRPAYYAWLDYAKGRKWADAAGELGIGLAQGTSYDVVVSCGPPHMAHAAAHRVGTETGTPYVMDLRDPWTLVERLADPIASPVWYRLARRYEPPAVSGAALVVMNTEPASAAMRRAYPDAAGRILTVSNGYDEDRAPSPGSRERFTVIFAGSVYLDRDPGIVLRAAATVIKELRLSPKDFHVEFIGNVGTSDDADPSSIPAAARREGLAGFVGVSGFQPRHELARSLAGATVLVSLNQDSELAVPSKVFEYMQYDAWLLALAEPESATAQVLNGLGADVVSPRDASAVAHALRSRYEQFTAGARPTRLAARAPQLSRRAQAAILFAALDRVVGRPQPVIADVPVAAKP